LVFHNAFSLSTAATFGLGQYHPGERRSRRFTATGPAKVFRQIHSQLNAAILVLDHHEHCHHS